MINDQLFLKSINKIAPDKLLLALAISLLSISLSFGVTIPNTSNDNYITPISSGGSPASITYALPADLSTISYNDEFLSISSQDLVPTGLVFSQDGKKLYMLGSSNDEVYEYSLTVPFDILCATFTGNKLDVAAQETVPTGIAITPDGTKLFMTGNLSDRVHQYDMSTAFDLSTATLSSTSLNVFQQDRAPRDITFSNDGTQLFLVGDYNDAIFSYDLGMAFNIGTATLSSNTRSTVPQDVSPRSIDFNADGSVLFLTGITGDKIYKYDLSSPFDISTAIFSSSFDISAQATNPQGIVLSTQGDRFLIIGNNTDKIYHYDLDKIPFTESVTIAGSVQGAMIIALQGDSFQNAGSTLTNNTDYSIDNLPTGLVPVLNVASHGKSATLTFSGSAVNNDDIHDIDNLIFTFNNSAFVGNNASVVNNAVNAPSRLGIDFTGGSSTSFMTYAANIDLSSIEFNNTSLDIRDQDLVNTGIELNVEGTKMYMIGTRNDEIYEYDLKIPFDISCAIFTGNSLDVSSQELVPTGMAITPDGTKLFMTGNLSDKIHQYDLSTAFDLSTATLSSTSLNVFQQDRAPRDITFNNDGTQLFLVGDYNDAIFSYDLGTAFDIATATFSSNTLNTAPQENSPRSFVFNANGTALFLLGIDGDKIYQYDLSVAYDISTANFITSEDLSSEVSNPQGIAISPQGDRMLISDNNTDKVFEYDLTKTPFSETSSNNGAVQGSMIIAIMGDAFDNAGGTLTNNVDFNIPNLPTGLTPTINVASNGLSAVLTLSGNAASHDDIDDIADLRFTFENSSFVGGDASVIAGAINESSNLGIDFNDSGSSTSRIGNVVTMPRTEEILQSENINLSIAPNPTSDYISIISTYKVDVKSSNMVSLNGQRIKLGSRLQTISDNEFTISMEGLKPGIYILEINGEDGSSETRRVVKN